MAWKNVTYFWKSTCIWSRCCCFRVLFLAYFIAGFSKWHYFFYVSFAVMCFSFLRLIKFFRASFSCSFTDIAGIFWNRNSKANKTKIIQNTDNAFSKNNWQKSNFLWISNCNISPLVEIKCFFGVTNRVIKWFLFMFRDFEMTLLHTALCIFTGAKENWHYMLMLLYHCFSFVVWIFTFAFLWHQEFDFSFSFSFISVLVYFFVVMLFDW